jgi:hypothetical protein
MAWAARIESPVAIEPESATGPSKRLRISPTSANGDSAPAWPQPVHPGLERLFRVAHIYYVMQNDPAITVHGINDFPDRRTQ